MSFVGRCEQNYVLAKCSTFDIGGKTRYFFVARTLLDLTEALLWIRQHKIPYFIVGNGSNCLFRDEGFDGIVIHNKIDFFEELGKGHISVGSGYGFARLGVRSAQDGWGGLEFASTIPGTVGGALFMNAGAYGMSTFDTVVHVGVLNNDGKYFQIEKKDIQVGYRYSSLQDLQGIIVSAQFKLIPNSEAFHKQKELSLLRRSTQPYDEKSAGCCFRNPSKNSAGKLIEEVGLKGFQIGGAQVSTVHANFIVNTGGATAHDVRLLIQYIQEKVQEKKGILLVPEIQYVGEYGGRSSLS